MNNLTAYLVHDQTTRRPPLELPDSAPQSQARNTTRIHEVKPEMCRIDDKKYLYIARFCDHEGRELSRKEFVFINKTDKTSQGQAERKVFDVYSQNGKAAIPPRAFLTEQKDVPPLFTRSDIKGIKRAMDKLRQLELNPGNNHTVLVLDLKDPNGSYRDRQAIEASENAVCEYLTSEIAEDLRDSAKKVHHMLRSNGCFHYLFREGSLKVTLAEGLSQEQQEFFLERDTEGHKSFCEYTEPFINAFKLGHEVEEIPQSSQYLSSLLVRADFDPKSLSSSITWYPEQYQELYNADSPVFSAFKEVFRTSMESDLENSITVMSVEAQ